MRVSHVLRRLLQLPVFTTIAVLTLAIGIGANAAIFSVIDGVLLKPLPYPHPEELVVLDQRAAGLNLEKTGSAPFLYFTFREDGRLFQDVALWTSDTESVTGLAEPEEVPSLAVTDGLLPMLGATPALGRLISKQDDTPGSADVMVLSAGYWHTRFGSDPSAIGRRVIVNESLVRSSASCPIRSSSSTESRLSSCRCGSTDRRHSLVSSATTRSRA